MHGPEKSDPAIRAGKRANKAGRPAAERVEQRPGPRRTPSNHVRAGLGAGEACPWGWFVYRTAKQRKKEKITTPLHHVTVDLLRDAFLALTGRAAPGVDGVTWRDYEADLERNLLDLHARIQRGPYRALPVK